MRTLIFVLLFIIVLTSSHFSQTQLLRVGNAVEFGDMFGAALEVTVEDVTINGKIYLKKKLGYQPWYGQNYFTGYSYERIEGDSVHYILSANNTDSLSFNFNWPVGKVFYSYTVGNTVYEKKIDNITIGSILIPQDTLYNIIFYSIDLATGDTTYGFGVYFGTTYSKKLGKTDEGIFISLQGAKIDGVRYGSIMLYPEEIVFSEDSIYIPTLSDSGSTKIVNSSDYPVRVDSIISVGSFYGYWGNFTRPGFQYPFYLFQTMPGFMGDTLGIVIPPHDSINVSFYDVDLCPICDYEVQDYFEDTLRFVFTFMDGNVYSFSKSIPISGEGHPSDVKDEEVLPKDFVLEQNYPNPFNPSTTISWQSPEGIWQTIKVYDVLGNEIATLVNEYRSAGNYEIQFDASRLANGIYYYQLRAGDYLETKKMVLLK